MWNKGDVLPGNRVAEYSYCVCDVPVKNSRGLEEVVIDFVEGLSESAVEWHGFIGDGGSAEIFISLDREGFLGVTFGASLIKRLGELEISLSIDRLS
ncbi:MAG: hypothetical protein QM772_01980 [Ottowia sp.]|uniref:hypothetical protein n=1 Tax=Ottowia sp. TaxID=1898956 RepID=UPI0039E36CEF